MIAPVPPLVRQVSGAGAGLAFVVFAATYFLSALLRAVTATLAPEFSAEFGLTASELGLLAGAYFLGFSLLQLPLGAALDRWGPRRTEALLVMLAVVGCGLFALAASFIQMVAARVLIGMGVAACLMAPLTYFRRHLPDDLQLRMNSWMLMTGSLGMLASTVPVQWVVPLLGWRGLFGALALLLAATVVGLLLGLRRDPADQLETGGASDPVRYADIARHPEFVRLAPMGFVLYGGLIAVQALWAGPWLTRVNGWSAASAGLGLLMINTAMLLAFFAWGVAMPVLVRRGVDGHRLLRWGAPVGLLVLAAIAYAGTAAAAVAWTTWCVATSVLAVSQPLVGQAFPVRMAGRALSAFNLVIFAGIFVLQWGIGVVVDWLQGRGLGTADAFRSAIAILCLLGWMSYVWYRLARGGNIDNVGIEART